MKILLLLLMFVTFNFSITNAENIIKDGNDIFIENIFNDVAFNKEIEI
jgi:hypothetical protein